MKKLSLLMSLLAMLLVVWSCEEKDNMEPLGEWELTQATPGDPAEGSSIVLNEADPSAELEFTWQPAVSSKDYQVRYTVGLYEKSDTEFANPILSTTSENGGKDLVAYFTAKEIDYALSVYCYAPGSTVDLNWAVIAKSLDKQTLAAQAITFTRFASEALPTQLFLSGAGSEAGEDAAQAIPMKAWKDADGNQTFVFELYTSLQAGENFHFRDAAADFARTYGRSEQAIVRCGEALSVSESGEYRITVDLKNKTYELLKIEHWSVVGGNIAGGWGGDEPLAYVGNSIWQDTVELVQPAGFLFRANGDWAYLLKRIQGTENELVMESQAPAAGIAYEDIPSEGVGKHVFTLSLQADKYTYSMEEVKVEDGPVVTPPTETPAQLFLLAGSEVIAEFVKDGEVFSSEIYMALQAGVEYTLNSASDGSGTSYIFGGVIGESENSDADAVVGNLALGEEEGGKLSVAVDQPYAITVNFETNKASWKYYNMKLFHWDEVGGGWDNRLEARMTYVHPYTYEVTADLTAGYDSKFNSPWDIQLGADADPSALEGIAINGGVNFRNITQSGTYKATIEVANDYSQATYSFVKQ